MNRKRILLAAAAAVAVGLVAAPPALAQGCAMCGTAFRNGSDPLARSMASSIVFMISMPFFLFFSAAGWIVYRFHKSRPEGRDDAAVKSQESKH